MKRSWLFVRAGRPGCPSRGQIEPVRKLARLRWPAAAMTPSADAGGTRPWVPWAPPDESGRLSRHYIPARHPDAHPSGAPGSHYREADATQALADAERVLGAVDGAWAALGQEPG